VDDIVAIRVKLASGGERFFLTYGRIFDTVEATGTLDAVAENLSKFDLGGRPVRVELCHSLQEAKDQPYFFEAVFSLAQTPIPLGAKYKAWRRKIAKEMESGQHLHYLGRRKRFGRRRGVTLGR
jgi:hypothetical protein